MTVDPTLIHAGAKVASPVVGAALSTVCQTLKAGSQALGDKIIAEFRLGFSEFLNASYNRCKNVKTLISGDRPVSLADIYVRLFLKCGDVAIEDIGLIDQLENYNRIVITGTGGAGKSMMMKYLTISRFENTKGKIPLFVELRNLNTITKKDLLQFAFSSCTTAKNKVKFSTFEEVIKSGGFILILDGFDEIDQEHRDEIEKQILNISRNYTEMPIVVSGRFDPRFKSWADFYVFSVEKLTVDQSRQVISRAVYDEGIKKRFLRDITSLWKTHETFLSVPLLSIIMLLTFGKFSEISPKTTLFYKLAFQALFREHDASKEQFKRPLESGYDLDDFEKCFSAFCAISYLDGKVSFDRAAAKSIARDAISYARLAGSEDAFINDLVKCICILQEDGTELSFVHRSFQEYFTAVFCASYNQDNLFEILFQVSRKMSDSTLLMLSEIDKSKLEKELILPLFEKYENEIEEFLERNDSVSAIKWLIPAVMIGENGASGYMIGINYSTLKNISKISSEYEELINVSDSFRLFESIIENKDFSKTISKIYPSIRTGKDIYIKEKDRPWLDELNWKPFFSDLKYAIGKIREDILQRRKFSGAIIKI